ncbi:hypothetical protein [Thalassospira sp. MCCC 1A03138]|uniref:hypothetical protein n=1 Tax=Thalassospira sp. MCCC 1A03138 TaxID=1470576 RepID=UPI00111C4EA1|nr:hypothetical protein [Thalassospira sp. MCCC 1A03138]
MALHRPAFSKYGDDLHVGRLAIACEILGLLPAWEEQKDFPRQPKNAGPVSTDIIDNNLTKLHSQIGSDILCLSLLADVPLDRPLHITQNSLIGHWRWLRQVWTKLAIGEQAFTFMPEAQTHSLRNTPKSKIVDELEKGRFNTAIANLRSDFKSLSNNSDSAKNLELRLSFIKNLTLFCPLIGSELLYRLGHAPFGTNHHAKNSEE